MSGPDPSGDAAPDLSIVLASRAGEGSLTSCLEALGHQLGDEIELVLVEDERGSGQQPTTHTRTRRVVHPGGLVPELWADGIRQASGHLVGLLAATVVPEADWVALTLKLHESGAAGVGGGIEPGSGMRLVDWAVFFCRYAPYMAPIHPDPSLEIAGDNASYRREVLQRYADLYETSFSEPFVHRAMRADGHVLRVEPVRVVRHIGAADARGFCRQRYLHGREHGRLRSVGQARSRVLLGAATAPLVPLVMTLRVARHVRAKHRHAARFVAASPLVVWFYSWWAAGELMGRLGSVAASPSR